MHRTETRLEGLGAQGAPNDRVPSQPTKPYGIPGRNDDYVAQASENVVEMEAFSVPRGANGRCDWDKARTKRKQHPIAESSYQGERHERTCNGVMYFYPIPTEYQIGGDSTKPGPGRSVSIAFPPSLWEGPDTLKGRGREARDVVNLVLPRLRPGAKVAGLTIEDETRARVRRLTSPAAGIEYSLDKKNGRWVLSPTERVFNVQPPPPK